MPEWLSRKEKCTVDTVQSFTQVVKTPRAKLNALVWGTILFVSIPQIILHLLGQDVPGGPLGLSWLEWAQMVVLAALWAATWVWPAAKPLRGFVLALLAYQVGTHLIGPFMAWSEARTNWSQRTPWGVWLVVNRLHNTAIPVALVALTLIGSRIGRRELFLVRGNLNAPAQPARLLQGKRTMPWNLVVRGWLPYFVLIVVAVEVILVRPRLSQIPRALIYLPAIAIAAAINAFAEEFIFRSVVLARLEPALGPGQAILIAAGLFGLLHYFGDPGSVQGVLLAAYLGWIAAKSMIETRSIIWAFLIHFVGDFILYVFWAMVAA
jgi:membrane protease YdiL (CAAX protease family)